MSLLPPLLLELMSNGKTVIADLEGVDGAVTKLEATTASSTTKMQAAFSRTAAAGKIIGTGVLVGGVVIAAASAKIATDFQSKMNLLTVSAGETQGNMKTVSNGILNLAGATGTSVDQLSDGMYTIEKAGDRGAAGLTILKAAAEGAKAENVNLATATNALTSVMMSYHEKSGDAVKVQNEIIAGSGRAKTTMAEYAGSLSTVIPVASAAGISFAQVAGAIATLTQHGTSAQESTQELANTIRNLQAPNAVASSAMQQLGLNSVDVSAKLGQRGLTGTIGLITDAIQKKMGPAGLVVVNAFKESQSASADLQTMLGKMPPQLAALSKQYMDGKIGLTDYRTAFRDLGGQGTAMGTQFLALSTKAQGFNDMVKAGNPAALTFSGTLKQVMGGATGLNTALMLGGQNMDYFKKATNAVTMAGQKNGANVSTWAQTQKTLKVQLDQAGASIEAMGVRLGTVLIPMISGALKAGEQFIAFLQKNPPVLYTIIGIIGGAMVIAIGAYITKLAIAAVQSTINFAKMVASGVAWAVQTGASIGESLALWGMYFAEWVAKTAAATATWIAGQAEALADWVVKNGTALARSAVLYAQYYGPQMAKWVAQNAVAFASMIAKGAAWVAATAVQLAVSGAKWAAATAATVGSMAAQNAAMIAQKAILLGGAVATGVATAAQWLFNAAMDANPIGLIILAIAALIAAIILLVTHWKQVTDFLSSTWKTVSAFVVDSVKNIGNWFNSVFSSIGTFVSNAFKGAANLIIGFFNFIIDAINTVISGLDVAAAGIKNITGGAINFSLGKLPHIPSFDVGGTIPGAAGQPLLMVGHGGEVVLSRDMLSGRAPVPPQAKQAIANSGSNRGGNAGTGPGRGPSIGAVHFHTNADPGRIMADMGWLLRRQG